MGDPVRPLLWVSKSCDKLASALVELGHAVSARLLIGLGFPRQFNRKADEGSKPRIPMEVARDSGMMSPAVPI